MEPTKIMEQVAPTRKDLTDKEARRRAFIPRGAARALMACREPEVIIYGASGSGKSRTVLEKIYAAAQKYPGMRAAVVRKFRSTITQSAIVTFEQLVVAPGDGVKFNTVSQEFIFPNKSVVVVAGLDDPTKILSTEFDIIYVQECTEIDEPTWEMLTTRLRWSRMPYQQIIGDCNPDSERHWIKRREKSGKVKLIRSEHKDNPLWWDEDKQEWTEAGIKYIDKLKAMSGHMRERFYEGKWVGAEGLIYTEYDTNVNLIDPFPIPREWTRYLSIDFGYNNPFCFSKDTEILTSKGWKLFSDLHETDLVGTISMETREFSFQKPTDYISYHYKGEMIVSNSRHGGVNFSVTPNHDMVLEYGKYSRKNKLVKYKANVMPEQARFVTTWNPSKSGITPEIDPEFLGLLISEGYVDQDTVSVVQKKYKEKVQEIFNRTRYTYKIRQVKNGATEFRIHNRELVRKIESILVKAKSADKSLPINFREWNSESLEKLLQGLILGDGSNTLGKAKCRLYSSSKQLLLEIQEVGAILGIQVIFHEGKELLTPYGKSTIHYVSFPTKKNVKVGRSIINKEFYDDMVYCVTVPNGTLITKRNGRYFVSGNCCQWWAMDHDGRLYLYRELYGTNTPVEDWAHEIHELSKKEEFKAIICDHDLEDRATLERHMGHSEDQCFGGREKQFWKVPTSRIRTVGADKERNSVQAGIEQVQSRFKKAGDGKPRLFIFKEALVAPDERLVANKKPTCTEEEIDNYIWDEVQTSRLGQRKLEQPRKIDDHGMDAMRYVVRHVDAERNQGSSTIFGQNIKRTYQSGSSSDPVSILQSKGKLGFFKER